MSNLFQKAVMWTDIHVGLKSNSITHLEDCMAYVQWMVNTAKANGCETCFFLGDFHNNRASINILSLNYSIKILELISKSFEQVFFIPGNHDQFYRDKRDVQSVEWAKHLPNITIVNDFFQRDNVSIVPWLVGDEHKRIQKINAEYMLGHFELPHFFMNSLVRMPDHGDLRSEHLGHIGSVFSGHFHKRQTSDNITYIGNCFPHNYADASDDARGCMILEWGGTPEYHTWPDQPTYRVYNLSDVLTNTTALLKAGMHVRVNLDIDISYEEANYIREQFSGTYGLRDITLMAAKTTALSEIEAKGSITFDSVDTIVSQQLSSIEVGNFDPKLLLEIYRNL